jgi:nitrogen-specific signal transduction histidine kinase
MLDVPGVHAVFAMARDVTERERMEEQLRETQRLESLGLLAGGVAHDFNNLLTAILGYADELARVQTLDVAMTEGIGEIRRAGLRARELTTQLLTFARRQLVVPKTIDVAQQLAETERFLRRLIGEDIVLQLDVAPGTGHVRIDPAQFEQVLVNLAANARDVMPNGGELVIDARPIVYAEKEAAERGLPAGDYVQLVVRDTGTGMSPTVAERVFEPFFTTKELGKGTGLGLATVYGIIRQAGGQIDVASRPGAGTSFVLSLPRVTPDPECPSTRPVEPACGGHERILLVEDDAAVRKLALRILRGAGYEVVCAESGVEAEQLAADMSAPVALLVTDVVMPGMSGPELATRLASRWGTVPTLFVSGYTEERLQASDIVGDKAFLAKPYNWQELLTNVRGLLDRQIPGA